MFVMPTQGPILMVGPGTGVVPFIGFLETFEKTAPHSSSTHLYFGCRRPDSDYIFKDFLESATKNNLLSSLNVAFSRTDNNYVQDLLTRDKEKLMNELESDSNSTVCICGNTKMGQEVMKLLKEWLGPEQVTQMEQQKRIVKELWSS